MTAEGSSRLSAAPCPSSRSRSLPPAAWADQNVFHCQTPVRALNGPNSRTDTRRRAPRIHALQPAQFDSLSRRIRTPGDAPSGTPDSQKIRGDSRASLFVHSPGETRTQEIHALQQFAHHNSRCRALRDSRAEDAVHRCTVFPNPKTLKPSGKSKARKPSSLKATAKSNT